MKKLFFLLLIVVPLSLTSCDFTPTQKSLAKIDNLEMPLWVENNIYIVSNNKKIVEDKNCVFYPLVNQSKDKIIYSHKNNFVTAYDVKSQEFNKIYELPANKSNFTVTAIDWLPDNGSILLLLKDKNGLIAKNELIDYNLDLNESKLVSTNVASARYFKTQYLLSNTENIFVKNDNDKIVKVLKAAKGANYDPIMNLSLSKNYDKLIYNIGPDYYIYEFKNNKNIKVFTNATQNIADFNDKDEIIVSDYNKITTYNYKTSVLADFLKVKKNSFAQW